MENIKSIAVAAISLALLGFSSIVNAAPITIPAGLNSSDQY
jgi:hypothetical protein